jgi:hypothetical protein
MDANAIASAMKTALTPVAVAISGVAFDYIPSQPQPPSIWAYPEDVSYYPGSTWKWMVQAVVGANVFDEAAQQTLRSMLNTTGDASVLAAIVADRTLGGTVDDVIVTSAAGFQVFDLPNLGLVIGSTWTLGVLGTG